MMRPSFMNALVSCAALSALACSEGPKEKSNDGVIDYIHCGPCGTPVLGDVTVAGNVKIDGKFLAVADLDRAARTISRDFEHDLDALVREFGTTVPDGAGAIEKVNALVASIRSEVETNVGAPLVVDYVPARCAEDVTIAVDAQVQCEARNDCEPGDAVDPLLLGAQCEGSCDGACLGSCSDGCTGRCFGTVTPPIVSQECAVGALCQPQARVRAAVGLACTPVLLTFSWDAAVVAPFETKIAAIRRHGTAILEGAALLSSLLEGEIDDEVVLSPSPLELLLETLEADVMAGVDNELFRNVPVERITCALNAYESNIYLVEELAARHATTIGAQSAFRRALASGFAR